MEREEEFREKTIDEIKMLKLKIKYLYVLVVALFGFGVIISFLISTFILNSIYKF